VAIYHRPEARTPHPTYVSLHRPHSRISGGDHFLVKNPYVLAFYIIENGHCVAIDHRPEAHTPHPTYISLPYITFLDLWWRPFLGQKYVGVSLRYY
jgi:hypothetical protein